MWFRKNDLNQTENTPAVEVAHQTHEECEENTVDKNWPCYLTVVLKLKCGTADYVCTVSLLLWMKNIDHMLGLNSLLLAYEIFGLK